MSSTARLASIQPAPPFPRRTAGKASSSLLRAGAGSQAANSSGRLSWGRRTGRAAAAGGREGQAILWEEEIPFECMYRGFRYSRAAAAVGRGGGKGIFGWWSGCKK